MSFRKKLVGEVEELTVVFIYFALCFLLLIALKKLILEDYQVGYYGLSAALIGALIVAKVVLILEFVPLGGWVQNRAVIVDVVLRTILYSIGVLIAVILEHGFEQRHEHGGFGDAMVSVVQNRDKYHVWVTAIAVGVTILGFNLYSALSLRFGNRELLRLFFKTPLKELESGLGESASAPLAPAAPRA